MSNKNCTYTFTNGQGQKQTIMGLSSMKAFLVDGGLDLFYPSGKFPWLSTESAIDIIRPSTLQAITPDQAGNMRAGDIVVDGQGNEYMALHARHKWLEVAPIVDGRPQVSADTTIKFHLEPETKHLYRERRGDPIYATGRNRYNQETATESRPAAEPSPSSDQFAGLIAIAADSIESLRRSDVDRVITEAPSELRQQLANYIKSKRPDLAGEVDEVTAEAVAQKPSSQKYTGPADASSRAGQMELANRAGTIAALKAMNAQLRAIAPDEAWADANIEDASNLDKLRDQISAALVRAQETSQTDPNEALQKRLENASGADLRAVFDLLNLAGSRMSHSERVNALLAEDAQAVSDALDRVLAIATEPSQQQATQRPTKEETRASMAAGLRAGTVSVEDFMKATGLTDEDIGTFQTDGLRQQAERSAKERSPYHQVVQEVRDALSKMMTSALDAASSTPQQRKSKEERIAKINRDRDTLEMIARKYEHPFDNNYVSRLSPVLKSRFKKKFDEIQTGFRARDAFNQDSYDAWTELLIDAANKKAGVKAAAPAKASPAKTTPASGTPAGYGAKNTLVTADRAAELRARLKQKLNQLNAGIDPELLAIGVELAAFHIEAGVRRFADFARTMASDLDQPMSKIRPYLRSWYNGARDMMEDAGVSIEGMDNPDVVRETLRQIDNQTNEDAPTAQESQDVPSADERVERDSQEPAAEPALGNLVQADAGDLAGDAGGAGGQTAGSRRRGQPRSDGVPAGGAAADGNRGDFLVPGGDAAVDAARVATGADFGERGSDIGVDGVSVDPIPAEQVVAAAEAGNDRVVKLERQRAAEKVTVVPGDLDNIRATLPYLLEGQQEDVKKAEDRFAQPDGYGMLFTNGTGTGKTFTGLGAVKRFQRQSKTSILIVVPDDKIAADWIESGEPLGLSITQLKDAQDAGQGIVITSYANLGKNDALARRQWDMVVADEAHTLMQSADGKVTTYLANLRAITHHPDGATQRFTMLNRADIDAMKVLNEQIDVDNKVMSDPDTMDVRVADLRAQNERLEAERGALRKKLDAAKKAVQEEVNGIQGAQRARLLALSATPFAYEFTVDWANGYLFDYDEGQTSDRNEFRGYNQGSNRDRFFMTHFGYSMRTNRLTKPDPSKVDTGLMQRSFNGWLRKKGSLSARMLDVAADYDRRFVLVDSGIGNQIDDALNWLSEKSRSNKGYNGYAVLRQAIDEKFDHLSRRYLLEAIKATEVVPIVRQHMAMGRKVVVFHDYKKGGGFNPFKIERVNEPIGKEVSQESFESARRFNAALDEFNSKFKSLVNAPLGKMDSPIEVFSREFPDVLLINGDEKKKDLLERYKRFQDDASGPQVMLVQSAKNKGWSGHDTTGKHQRVLINLGQPTAPTLAIQQEGRIYRTGQVSDAIMRYLNTGTNWEKWTFATTIAGRAGTAENLGMGEQARALKDSFVVAFEESDAYPPGHEGEGKGGKERDKLSNSVITVYDRAKTYYWATQKKTSKTKAQEGKDYFATPEPLGFKMAEWLGLRGGEDSLEPSAGHGAIARWLPENTSRTVIEPSMSLRARLAMAMDPGKDRIIDGTFEDHAIVNKYDGVAMNPPFGVGGKTAIEHLDKAAKHLRDGGRIVALIPTGPAADKRFDQWMYGESVRPTKPMAQHPQHGDIYRGDTVSFYDANGDSGSFVVEGGGRYEGTKTGYDYLMGKKGTGGLAPVSTITSVKPTGARTESYRASEGLYTVAEIKLPQVTFERAGTAVATRIVVLEKHTDPERFNLNARHIDLSGITDINALFDRLEDISLPPRAMTAEQEAAAPKAAPNDAPAKKQPKAANPDAVGTVDRNGEPIIEHVTKKGKTLRGIVRTDMPREEAEKIDPHTFRKDGGWFIRAVYLKPEGGKDSAEMLAFSRGSARASAGVNWQPAADQSAAKIVAAGMRADQRNKPGNYDYTIVEPAKTRLGLGNLAGDRAQGLTDALYRRVRDFEAAFGRRVVFVRADNGSPDGFSGFIMPKSDPDTIYVNINADINLMSILGHEFYEGLVVKNPQLHSWFLNQAARQLKDGALKSYSERLARAGDKQRHGLGRFKEMLADFAGDALADPEFRRSLEKADPSKFRALIRSFREFLIRLLSKMRGRIVGTGIMGERTLQANQHFKDVQALRDALRDVIRKADSGGNLQQFLADGGALFSRSQDQTQTEAFKRWYSGVDGQANRGNDAGGADSGSADGSGAVERGAGDGRAVQRRGGLAGSANWSDSTGRITLDGTSGPTDGSGAPVVFFHGTRDDLVVFRTDHPNRKDAGWLGRGIYGTSDPDVARDYAERKRGPEAQNVMPLYFAVKNPYPIDQKTRSNLRYAPQSYIDKFTQQMRERGHDGAIYDHGDGVVEIVAFEPTQVKSAIGNNGAFDPANPDIRFSRAMPAPSAQPSAWTEPGMTRFDDFVYKLQDKLIDTKRVQAAITKTAGEIEDELNAYQREELYHGRAAKRAQDFLTQELNPMVEQLAKDKIELADFEEYLHARHAPEANRVLAERNPNQAMIDAGLEAATQEIEEVELELASTTDPAEIKLLSRRMREAQADLSKWSSVQPFRGTEEDRLRLSGMSDDQARAIMDALTPEQRAKLDAAAAQFDAIVAQNRQLMVDYDLEDQETIDSWSQLFQHYVPLMREDEGDGVQQGMGTGQGFSIKGREVKSRTGSTRKVVDIVANVAMQRERIITRGEKNRVSQALMGLAALNPNPDFWKLGAPDKKRQYDPATNTVKVVTDPQYKNRENVVVAKVRNSKGRVTEVALTFNERDARAVRMAAAIKNLEDSQLGTVMSWTAKITRYMASINTQYNPIFGVVNLVRDLQGAVVNLAGTPLANSKARVVKNAVLALADIYLGARQERKGTERQTQWGRLWQEFQEVGGMTGFRDQFRNSGDRARAIERTMNPEKWMESAFGKVVTAGGLLKTPMTWVQDGGGWVLDLLSDYNLAMENGVRLAAYKEGLDKGLTQEQAASLAKNITVNFNRRGSIGLHVGSAYAFFNAAMQGTARMGQAMTTMEDGKLSTLRLSALGKQVVAGGLAMGVAQAVALSMAGFGEDEPPQFVREKNLIIPTGWTGIGSEKGYLTVPMPLSLHVIPGLGRHLTEFAMSGGKNPAERVILIMGMLLDAFNPIGNAGWSLQTIVPTVLDPLAALAENKDYTGRNIAIESRNPNAPGHTLARDTASTFSKLLSEAINTLTGGNEYVSGVMSPTPDQIDYLIGQVTGGVGREALKVEQTVRGAVTGEEVPLYKIPLVGRFAGDSDGSGGQATIYRANVNRLDRAQMEIDGLRKDGRFQESEALRQRSNPYLLAQARAAESQVQRLRRMKRDMVEKGASRESVREVERKISEAMGRLNRAVEAQQR